MYVAFLERVEQAQALGEAQLIIVITGEARAGSWQAASRMLERQFPTR